MEEACDFGERRMSDFIFVSSVQKELRAEGALPTIRFQRNGSRTARLAQPMSDRAMAHEWLKWLVPGSSRAASSCVGEKGGARIWKAHKCL